MATETVALTRKILTVFGATGKQGGSVIETFLTHPILNDQFALRAVTRDKTSARAKALEAKGVDVYQGDLNDPKTLAPAVTGAHIVFGTTNFWDPASGKQETSQGKNIADVSAAAKVSLLIWSTLPNKATIDALSGPGTDSPLVQHFETKAEVDEYIKTALKGKLDAAFLNLGLFLTNFLEPPFAPFFDKEAGNHALRLPLEATKPNVPIFSPHDTGVYVAALALAPHDRVANKRWYAASAVVEPQDIAKSIAKAVRKEVEYEQIPVREWAEPLPEFIRHDLMANLQLADTPGYFGPAEVATKNVDEFHKLIDDTGAGKVTTAEEFFKQNLKLN